MRCKSSGIVGASSSSAKRSSEPHRFDELERNLGIDPKILSGRLRRLFEQEILVKAPYGDWPLRHEYRLTERGLDLYPVPLAMLTWGKRWLPTNGPDIHLTHTPCGKALRAVLSCGPCRDTPTQDEIPLPR